MKNLRQIFYKLGLASILLLTFPLAGFGKIVWQPDRMGTPRLTWQEQWADAQNYDANSGENRFPEGASTIRQRRDSRWVNHDNRDQTDWLQVSAPDDVNFVTVTTIDVTRLTGRVSIETYGADPFGAPLERVEMMVPQVYQYAASLPTTYYFKVVAPDREASAQYTFSYTLQPRPTPTATPTMTPTALPTTTPTPTATPTLAPTNTPTVIPTPLSTALPTATPTLAPTATVTAIPATPAPTATVSPEALPPTATPILLVVATMPPLLTPTPLVAPTASPSPLPTATLSPVSVAASDSEVTATLSPSRQPLFLVIALIACVVLLVILAAWIMALKHQLSTSAEVKNDLLRAADYKLLGDFAAEHGKLSLAERCYRKATELEPYNYTYHYELGVFLFQSERYQESLKEFSIYLKNEIIVPDVYHYLAYAYLVANNFAKAEEFYHKSLEMLPNSADSYLGLGVIAQARGQYAQANEAYQRAIEIDPNCQEARDNLSQIKPYL